MKIKNKISVRRVFWVIVFLSFMLSFFPRCYLGEIFDETDIIKFIGSDVQDKGITSVGEYYDLYWKNIWHEPTFRESQKPLPHRFYRPLQIIYATFFTLQFHVFQQNPLGGVLLTSLIFALSIGAIYLLGYKITRNKYAAAGGAFFTMLSIPAISASWIIVSGSHALVLLLICISIFCYLRFKENNAWKWVVPIVIISVVAPFYKEYVVVALFTILALEVFSPARNWKFILLGIPLLLHSVFPAFLVNYIFYNTIVFSTTYQKLDLVVKATMFVLKLPALNHFYFIVPPVFTLIGIVCMACNLVRAKRFPKWAPYLSSGVFLLLFGALFVPSDSPLQPFAHNCCLYLTIIVSLSALSFSKPLAFWTLFSWIPFVLCFFNEVYLAYAVGLLVMILFLHINNFYSANAAVIKKYLSKSVLLKGALFLIIASIVLDQSFNVLAVFRVFNETSRSATEISRAIAQDTVSNKSNVLLASSLLGADVRFHLWNSYNRTVDVFGYTHRGQMNYFQNYKSPEKILSLIEREQGGSNIYFIDVAAYETVIGRLIKDKKINVETIHEYDMDVCYPYADVLKFFIPLEYTSFPGTPDMGEHVIMKKRLFQRCVENKYTTYKVVTDL